MIDTRPMKTEERHEALSRIAIHIERARARKVETDEAKADMRLNGESVAFRESYSDLDAAVDVRLTGRCQRCKGQPRIERVGDGGQCPICGLWVDGYEYGRGRPR